MPLIRTPLNPVREEVEKVKGSRFVADVAPCASAAAALAFVDAVRAREPSASHHCWAYLLHDGAARSSDAGEPAGTAGAPILRHIRGSGLVDVVVVVTRWFGGTKLGTGGLVRAYGAAAAAGLAAVEVVERPVLVRFRVSYDYGLSGAVESVLAAAGASAVGAEYGEVVTCTVDVPLDAAAGFAGDMSEATAGRVAVAKVDSQQADV